MFRLQAVFRVYRVFATVLRRPWEPVNGTRCFPGTRSCSSPASRSFLCRFLLPLPIFSPASSCPGFLVSWPAIARSTCRRSKTSCNFRTLTCDRSLKKTRDRKREKFRKITSKAAENVGNVNVFLYNETKALWNRVAFGFLGSFEPRRERIMKS